ncbi:MAG: hypothetical protein LBS05_08055 [Tannerellaceae bacterium]|jgi:hypothetical protein|nr:hypothetical protein [Tannerellaceae bacterium]
MENQLNEQESLRIIKDMIAQAKERFQKRNGDSIILWGYLIAILAMANFVLLRTLSAELQPQAYWVWMCTLPAFVIHYIHAARKARTTCAGSYIDTLVGHTWLAFYISVALFIASVFILAVALRAGGNLFTLIMPVIMSATGLCLFVNGKAYRFRPFVYGAIGFWVGALLSAIVVVIWQKQSLQFLVLAVCMIVGFILPGHLLNRKARHDV